MGRTKEDLNNILYSIVDSLELSGDIIEKHGPLGTPVNELVDLVLEEKDTKIARLEQGFTSINSWQEFHPRLAIKLSREVHNICDNVPHNIGIKLAKIAYEFYGIKKQKSENSIDNATA